MIKPIFSNPPVFKEDKKIIRNSKLWNNLLSAVNKEKDQINKSLKVRKPSQTLEESIENKKISKHLRSFRVVNISREKKQAKIHQSMIDNSFGAIDNYYSLNRRASGSLVKSESSIDVSNKNISAKSLSPRSPKRLTKNIEDCFRTLTTKFYQTKFDDKGKLIFKGFTNKITGKKDGKATEFYINGNKKYEGKFKNDLYHGKGKFFSVIGSFLYEGMFKYGKYCGLGKSFYPTEIIKHEGEYTDFYYNGQGNLYNSDGVLVYQGKFKNHCRHGQGTEYYSNKNLKRFEGKWKFDKKHGFGMEWDPEGNLYYEGNYAKGKFSGEGKRFYSSGSLMYEGAFFKNNRSGFGKAYYEDGGLMYEGFWERNYFHGKGTTYYESGKKSYSGNFVEGNQDGLGEEYYYDTGKVKYKGMFINNNEYLKGTYYSIEGKPLHSFDYSDDLVSKKALANTILLVKNIHLDIPKK